MAGSRPVGLERYDMSGKREALMLCVKKGNVGASGDLQIMKKFFKDYGFESEFVIDQSVQVMGEKLRALRDRINQSQEDISCVLVVTTSHGDRDGICDANNGSLGVEEIIQCFDDQKCPKLRGKPKVFMLDACRGSLQDTGVSADANRDRKQMVQLDEDMQKIRHSDYMNSFGSPWVHDMLVLYPTRPDFVAWMTEQGSEMFVKMAEVLKSADTEKEHLRDLFVKVNKKMVDDTFKIEHVIRKSVIIIESTLTKGLYLGRRSSSGPVGRRVTAPAPVAPSCVSVCITRCCAFLRSIFE